MPRLEDHVRMFHANCGGIVVGELGQALTCAECGADMTGFVSSAEEAEMDKRRDAADKCFDCGQRIVGEFKIDHVGRKRHAGGCAGTVLCFKCGCPLEGLFQMDAQGRKYHLDARGPGGVRACDGSVR